MRCCKRWIWMGVMIPVVAAAAFIAGCGGGGSSSGTDGGGSSDGSGTGSSKVSAKPKKFEERGTISGRIVVKNFKDKDVQDDLKAKSEKQLDTMKSNPDFKPCHTAVDEEEVAEQSWTIGDDGGLQNVVVWLSPPEDHYFQLNKDDLDADKAGWEKEKVLDQPHCQFHPHVMVLFQSYRDESGKKQKTVQKAIVRNSAGTDHNTKIDAVGFNTLLSQGEKGKKGTDLPALDPSEKKNYAVNCNVHTWMGGFIWSFDHPFAAVTDKDGKYTIKNAPAGSEVRLMVWHEKLGKIKDGEKITIKKDEDKKLDDISVEYKK